MCVCVCVCYSTCTICICTAHIVGLHTCSLYETWVTWLFSQHSAAPSSSLCLSVWLTWSKLCPLFHQEHVYALGLFYLFLCFASLPLHHAALLLFFVFLAVDPVHVLVVLPLSTLCYALSMYACQLKVHEMHMRAISENWLIIGWYNTSHVPLH